MAITRNSVARTPSPTPSENSDMYYEEFDDHTNPSPAPSQTADALGWESDSTPAPVESHDVTPTPKPARISSPASVVEVSGEDFPALAAPAPAAATKARTTKASKAAKGKGKGKAAAAVAASPTSDHEDPFLAADIARATALSLGLTSSLDKMSDGASSSRRPAEAPGSPSKRQRANTAGDAAPTPYAAVAATPVHASTTAPGTAPAAVPIVAPTTAPTAAPTAAPAAAAAVAVPPNIAPAAAAVAIPAVAPVVPPLWLTADGLPPRGSYTPTPVGGFPDLVYSPEQLLRGVPADLIRMYEDVAHPKFFLVVSGGNGPAMKTHGLIREAISNFINIDPTAFTLGTPPTAANGTSPALWLAADIPDHLAQAIIDTRILSSTSITLFALPYDMPVNGYIGVFTGFTLPNATAGANAAQDLLRTAIEANNEIAQFVRTHRDAFGPQVSAEQAWGIFLASVNVQGIVLLVNDTNTVAWCLYVTSPTNNREFFTQLRRLFGKIQVMTALHGTARLQRDFRCRICPSVNHPTPLCPLHSLPGWLGPTPATITALEDASRQAATRAQEQMRLNTFASAGGSSSRPGNGRNQGSSGAKPRGDAKGKRGDFKGKGKRRERDEDF